MKQGIDIKKTVGVAALVVITAFVVVIFRIDVKPSPLFLSISGKFYPTPTPKIAPNYETLAASVLPKDGFTVDIKWGDTGTKLVKFGGIDIEKYKKNYADAKWQEYLKYLIEVEDKGIAINSDNSYFWVNTLWALGLTQKSDVLERGVMGTQYKKDLGNFASTGGWTLGAKDAVKLYSSSDIIPLTAQQQALVAKVASGIYRPCCGNPTSFPDCNHGMAILGLLELMASQGKTEDEMYKAALAFNAYWFPQTYVDLAYYFQTKENTTWDKIDAKKVLGANYSSAQGYQAIKEQIGNIPGTGGGGGSCGA